VRQAVSYAIDRDSIIAGILQGYAQRLDGQVGPGQYGYNPELAKKLHRPYDPAKARRLLAQAGFPNGVDVELSTPVGRYTNDKHISEAMAQMLTEVGIRTRLLTPEWPTLWDNVQRGNVPFYYMGRGSVIDPGHALHQYFETGGSPRIGYSNPHLDALFVQERAAFDPKERKRILGEIFTVLVEEAPAHFLWRHQLLWGMTTNIEYTPRPDARIFAADIRVR
jgi:peptide/nickel transport system substrate-binding protein